MVTNSPWEACLIRLSWIISSELRLRSCDERPLNEASSQGPGPLQEGIYTEESGSDFGYAYRVFDNEDILLELDGSNNITARYTHGPGIDEPLILEKAGQSFFYHADGLGSITEITDSTGALKQQYTYSSFGKIESQLDPNFIQPYTFTAREFDPETDLYFYRNRTYDWRTGRFNQVDPILNPGNPDVPYPVLPFLLNNPSMLNPYVYAQNNPILLTDPSGLISGPVCNGRWTGPQVVQIFPRNTCACYWTCIRCGGGSFTAVSIGALTGSGGKCLCGIPGPEINCQCQLTPRSGGPPAPPPGLPEFRQAP